MKKVLYRPFFLSLLLTTNCFGVDEFLDVTPQDQQNMIPQIKFMYIHFYDAKNKNKETLLPKSNNQNIIFESADLKYKIQMDVNGSNIELYENNQIKNLISKLGYRLTWLNDSTQFAPRSGEPYSLEKFKNLINHECKVRGSLGLSFGRQGINNNFNEVFYGVFNISPKEFHVTFDRISFLKSIKNWSINKADTLCFNLPYMMIDSDYKWKVLNGGNINYHINIPPLEGKKLFSRRLLNISADSKAYKVSLMVDPLKNEYIKHFKQDHFIQCLNEWKTSPKIMSGLVRELALRNSPDFDEETLNLYPILYTTLEDLIKMPDMKKDVDMIKNPEIHLYPDAMIVMPENFDLNEYPRNPSFKAEVTSISVQNTKNITMLYDQNEKQYYVPLVIKEELIDLETRLSLPGNLVYIKTPIKFNKEEVESIIGCNNTSPLIIIPDIFGNQIHRIIIPNIFENQISTIRFYDHNTLNCKTSPLFIQSSPSLCLDLGPKSVERWIEMHKEPFIMKRFYDEFSGLSSEQIIDLREKELNNHEKNLKQKHSELEQKKGDYKRSVMNENNNLYEHYPEPITPLFFSIHNPSVGDSDNHRILSEYISKDKEDINKLKNQIEKIKKENEDILKFPPNKQRVTPAVQTNIINNKWQMICYSLEKFYPINTKMIIALDSISPRMYKTIKEWNLNLLYKVNIFSGMFGVKHFYSMFGIPVDNFGKYKDLFLRDVIINDRCYFENRIYSSEEFSKKIEKNFDSLFRPLNLLDGLISYLSSRPYNSHLDPNPENTGE